MGSPSRPRVLLHTEVMGQHLLTAEGPEGAWRLSGLIDFEPAMRGEREHELVGTAAFAADGDSRFLTRTLTAYGCRRGQLGADLRRRLLAWGIMHRYSNFTWWMRRLVALRSASILGSGFTLTDLATVTGRSAVDLSVVLAEAIRARVVENDGARLRFRHELIRDALYEDLAGSVRRALHREAGQRLAQAGAPALQVAEHLARGATPGDPEAVAWLARAARQAAPRSPDVAADLLDRAVGLMAPGDLGRDRLLAERASSLMWAGRIADAETACRLLLDRDLDPSPSGS